MNPTFLTYFLGCRTNQAEIEEIQNDLVSLGFLPAKPSQKPQIIIFNTCVVTKKAENEVGRIIRKFKKENPQSFLVVLGCGVEAQKRNLIKLPPSDLFLSFEEKEKLIEILKEKFLLYPSTINFQSKFAQAGRALIKIQQGCNHRCTYCIVPLVRGPAKSVSKQEILKKIKSLPPETKEIILTGTAISQWGRDLKPQKNLLDLINFIAKNTSVPKITLSSLDPEILDEKFAKFWGSNSRFSSFFHLSLQSGSSKVLKDMRRFLNFNKLNKAIQLIKQLKPYFVLRADIIVGFPTETEKDFLQTIQLIKQLEIAFTHVFPFSPRPGTLAFEKIKKGEWQDLPQEVKKQRLKTVQKETEKIRKKVAKNLKEKTLDCLLLAKTGNLWQGLAENSFPVKIKGKSLSVDKLVKAKITDFKNGFLYAEV